MLSSDADTCIAYTVFNNTCNLRRILFYYSGESAHLEAIAMESISLWNICREQLITFSMNNILLFRTNNCINND